MELELSGFGIRLTAMLSLQREHAESFQNKRILPFIIS